MSDWRIGSRVIISQNGMQKIMYTALITGRAINVLTKPPEGLAWKIIEDGRCGLIAEIVKSDVRETV